MRILFIEITNNLIFIIMKNFILLSIIAIISFSCNPPKREVEKPIDHTTQFAVSSVYMMMEGGEMEEYSDQPFLTVTLDTLNKSFSFDGGEGGIKYITYTGFKEVDTKNSDKFYKTDGTDHLNNNLTLSMLFQQYKPYISLRIQIEELIFIYVLYPMQEMNDDGYTKLAGLL